jgi:hypothetical protein
MRSFLASLLVILAFASVPAHAATLSRSYTAVPQSFSINGVDCPEVTSWSGGDLSGTVVEVVANSASAVTKKHISQVSYEPIVVKAVAPLSAGLSACLADLCAGRSTPVTLELSGPDPKPLQATNAQIMEAQFAALNGSSKDVYEITFVFRADSVQPQASPANPSVKTARSMRALSSNFSFALGSLDTSRVASIEPFTITRATVADSVGVFRLSSAQTGPTKFSNLVVVTSDASVESWTTWRDDFLARGNNADDKELAGSLTLLGPDLRTPLLSLQLSHVGIVRLAHNSNPADTIPRSTATLYCEQITLAQPGTNPAPAPTTNPPPATTTPTPAKDTTNPNDAGMRDPAGFPRPAGLTRTTYSKTDSEARLSETAGYSSDQTVTALLEAYVKVIAADGWKKDSINESGNTPADQMILSYWRKDKSQADLRLYGAKKGSTVSLSITTDK